PMDKDTLLMRSVEGRNITTLTGLLQFVDEIDCDILSLAQQMASENQDEILMKLLKKIQDKKKELGQKRQTEMELEHQRESENELKRKTELDAMLVNAVVAEDVVEVTRIIQLGGNSNVTCTYVGTDGATYKDNPLLLYAAVVESRDVVVALLQSPGIKVDAPDPEGSTALYEAAGYNNHGIVALLLEHNANPNTANNAGHTPLMLVAEKGYLNLCRLLLDHNADPNITDNEGSHSIWLAAQGGHRPIIEALIEHGGDPQQVVKCGRQLRTASWNAREEDFDDLGDWLDQQVQKK
ncbi:unnamed protein product, partial [Meganyctiphanes norvegica]